MQAPTIAPVAVITCPVCEADLSFEAHPLHDWKRGTVTLEIIISEEASVHLASHFGGEPVTPDSEAATDPATADAPEDAPPVVEPGADPDAIATPETVQEPAAETIPEPAPAPATRAKSKAKTA